MSKKIFITAILMLVAGISIGVWLADQKLENEHAADSLEAQKPLFYRHPMNPTVTSSVPAKDEMGMPYVPVYAEDHTKTTDVMGTVKIDPITAQNIGVRTTQVKRDVLSHVVRAVGRVDYDEERIVRLNPKVEGWIETMRVDKTGEKVKFN